MSCSEIRPDGCGTGRTASVPPTPDGPTPREGRTASVPTPGTAYLENTEIWSAR